MEKMDILIFDVGLGQSIFVYPHSQPEYGMLVDCGHTEDFHPIDFLLRKRYITDTLHNLTLTNYDQDHFSGLPYLRSKVKIKSVNFAKNLTSQEIKNLKETHTTALEHVCYIKDTYTSSISDYNPPYKKAVFHLEKEHLDNYDTNNLSQIVFIEYFGTTICISGDLEQKGWEIMLEKYPGLKEWLKHTHVFIASHHGRENGYHPEVFSHCKPECIIISDKGIVHDTQRDMASVYGDHIHGHGIHFNNDAQNPRKVLTTRSDGHLWLHLPLIGIRNYRNFKHDE